MKDPDATPQQPDESHLIQDTWDADPGSEGEVSQDPNWVPEHHAEIQGPVGSDPDGE